MAQPEPDGLSVAFDYVDPGSYAAFLLLGEVRELADDAGLRWCPLELRPPGTPPIDSRDATWAGMTDRVLVELGRIGVKTRIPNRVPLTRKAHELACHSKEYDRFDHVHGKLFEAHFEAGEDIGRVDVLVRIAAEAGLDPAKARTVLGVDRFGPAVEAERRRLVDEGIEGVPTVWSKHARIEGFRGIEAFRDGLEEVFNCRSG